MNVIILTTTIVESMSRRELGNTIIKKIVPSVMQGQCDPDSIGWIAQDIIKDAYPRRIKLRLGYDKAKFYRLDKDDNKVGRYLLDISG